jgi:cytochrome c biogenesis protein CcmG/thiol:disulfide interchange protein DsbE
MKRNWIIFLLITVIIASLGYGFLVGQDKEEQDKSTKKKSQGVEDKEKIEYPKAPDFTLKDLEGNEVSLSDYLGKVVIIDFWATWCGPCRKGIPEFVEMQTEYGKDNLVILGISVDRDDPKVVSEFAAAYEVNYPILYFTPEVTMAYGGITAIPTTFIVDRDGYVRDYFRGYRPKTYFTEFIDSIL